MAYRIMTNVHQNILPFRKNVGKLKNPEHSRKHLDKLKNREH